MKRTFLILLLFVSIQVLPQSKTDSILQQLPSMPEDSLKVKVYFDLFWLNYRNDYESSLVFAMDAERLTKELNMRFEYADALRVKSFSLAGMGRIEEAREELLESLNIFTSLNDRKMMADVKKELGWLSKSQSNYQEALEYFFEALKIAEEIGLKETEAQILNYVGGIYREQKQYEKAIIHFSEALALVEELDVKAGISACLTNLAAVYRHIGNYEKSLELHNRALAIKIEMGDKLGEARVLNNLGVLHNSLKNYVKAEQRFMEASVIAEEVGDKKIKEDVLMGLATSAFGLGNFERSIEISNQLLDTTDPYEDLEISVLLRNLLFKAYGELGNYRLAHQYALEWQTFSDSLYNKNMLTVTNDLEAKYQNEQKTNQIALLASEKELQTLQLRNRRNERNAIIALAILILILAVLAYNQYRIKQRSNLELRELDRLKSNFFANISHEFRTPLTLIKGPIEKYEQNPDEGLEQEEVRMIRRNTNRVLGLVNQLLEISKIDQGKLELKPTEGDIFKCLRAAAASFNSHAAQRNMDYRVDVPGGILWALFDRDKLEKIVYNLLSNAFKFSEDGEVVTFKAHHLEEELNIQVSDSGRGISQDKLPFIFDRFYQVDGGLTKDKEGSGIGLSLSKDLVELMDGTITVSSEEGKGTFFIIQLPIEKIEIRQAVVDKNGVEKIKVNKESQLYEAVKKDDRDLPQILLVEDNKDMRHFIRSQLLKHYRVQEAVNGDQGFKKSRSAMPDLIITDLMMPKMDGIELCKKLKTNIETSHIPIIMLTARAGVENKIEGLETGADDYLTKPFDENELLVRVKNLIDQRQRLREHYGRQEHGMDPTLITTTSLDRRFLNKVLALLEEKHSDPTFGVPQMQLALAMSKNQLHRKLKALTNEAPGELLRNFRLKRAAQLLSQNADTVTQIAYQVGFNNLSYFAKCFKELYGVSPSSYKSG